MSDDLIIRPKRDWVRVPRLSDQAMVIAVVVTIFVILLVMLAVTW